MVETLILFGGMIFLLIFRVPICFAMMSAAYAVFLYVHNPVFSSPSYLARCGVYAVDMTSLMAVPFFLLCGDLMVYGLAEKLINFVRSLVGWIKGALGAIMVLVCLLFGAISGSFMATIAAIGPIMLPEMEKEGYDRGRSSALLTASGFLGILIPPSIPSLIYATTASMSVATLFTATIVPGVVMALGYLVLNYILLGRHVDASSAPKPWTGEGIKIVGKTAAIAIPILFMPVLVLGGIYAGIFTPTEAGVVACVYGLIVGSVMRLFNVKQCVGAFLSSARTTAMVLILVVCAAPMGRIFSIMHIPATIASLIQSITSNMYGQVLIIALVIFIMGMFLDTNAIIFITVPVFLPLIQSIGFNEVQYAALTVVNLGIGCITPPFGFGLFMGAKVAKMEVHELIPKVMPYLIWDVCLLILLIFIPQLSVWLPMSTGMDVGAMTPGLFSLLGFLA